jgi:predicted XRE-type DNA-binding protein
MNKNKKRNDSAAEIAAEPGSGNVFHDLGLRNSGEALIKAEIALVIGKLIRGLDMTQAEVAAKLGVDQSKVSLLLRGRLKDFSVMRLVRFLQALEQDVNIVITPHRPPHLRKVPRMQVQLA